MNLEVVQYDGSREAEWDDFVENISVNGTFLQTWHFLSYHKRGRFNDCSLMFYDKEKLVAVCPACVIKENNKRVFFSHPGSTYGGILLEESMLRAESIKNLLDGFEAYLKENGFSKCILKPTMDLLCHCGQNLLEFFLYFYRYQESKELNLYIDYANYDRNIINNFSKMKRRNVRKCIEQGFELKALNQKDEIEQFHGILKSNLLKYNRDPVHTVDELWDLKGRFENEIAFYGAFLDNKMMAGTMVFIFEKIKCAHTQYLAADPAHKESNGMAFIYYKMAELFMENGFRYLSWGITSEHNGADVNYPLTNNKEEFGSVHGVNRIFEKILDGE